ncbi:hypothetical protein JHK84_035906 [Glycine max]|nr:hypothetical protein JHK84_035906 [Glycine max]
MAVTALETLVQVLDPDDEVGDEVDELVEEECDGNEEDHKNTTPTHTLLAHAASTHYGVLDDDVKQTSNNNGEVCGSFTSFLNNTHGSGFLTLGGFGLGHRYDNMGFGIWRLSWATRRPDEQ